MRIRTVLIIGLLIIGVLVSTTFSSEQKTMQIKVSLEDQSVPYMLRDEGFEVVHIADDYCYVFVNPEGYRQILEAGYRTEVIHEDVSAFYASRLLTSPPEPFGGYKTLSEIYAYLDAMIAAHPTIVTERISIGYTIEGREIFAVKISDNPDIDEDEPELFFNSLIHASEVISAEVLLYFMDYLTDNYGTDPQATDIVNNRELWFVLVMNPDGYYYNEVEDPNGGGLWRKNRRDNGDGTFGVDLNRNYGYAWAYDDFGSYWVTYAGDYRGTEPFSEPEAQAIRDFVTSRNFVLAVNYHAAGNMLLWPWTHDIYYTPDWELFDVLADSMTSYNNYPPIEWYCVNGTQEDWLYGEQTAKGKIMSFCVEVGSWDEDEGMWPDPVKIPELVSENLGVNLFLCRVADTLYSLAPPKEPSISVPSGSQAPSYTVSWSHDDAENPAQEYQLLEWRNPVIIIDSAETLDNWETNSQGVQVVDVDYYSPPTSFRMSVGEISFLQTREPVLVTGGDSLKFWIRYDLTERYGYVEISLDGIDFVSIPGNITTNDDPVGLNHGNGITGLSGGWIPALFDLSEYEGQSVYLRISCYGYAYGEEGFIGIDDIYFKKEFDDERVVATGLTDTYYDFTDMPDGNYYYRVRAVDAQGQTSRFSAFGRVTVGDPQVCVDTDGDGYGDSNRPENTCPDDNCNYTYNPDQADSDGDGIGDACEVEPPQPPYVCGDADGDGEVTQYDVAYLINYLHKDGPAPYPMEAGDANGDGSVDQLDARYLIEYLKKDGPAPICP